MEPRGSLIVVLVYGMESAHFLSPDWNCWQGETRDFTIHCRLTDEHLSVDLAQLNPDVIVSVASDFTQFKNLSLSPVTVRKKWLHYSEFNPDRVGLDVMATYLRNVFEKFAPDQPMVSVFTPVYNIGDIIYRPYHSLLEQTYPNWEWILFDDSTDGGKTYKILNEIAEKDHRIHVYRSERHSGFIGEMKYRCCALANGDIFAELDHDDQLTDHCLEWVVRAFQQYPDEGFVFTDSCEVFDGGGFGHYGDNWGFGYGTYRHEEYRGQMMLTINSPNINPLTVRHIIAMPNHVRAWRRETYFAIGGHNRHIHVVDDYEIMVRTFLHTKFVRIPRLGYIQWYNRVSGAGNTQDDRRAEIQRLVRHFRTYYNDRIHQRWLNLGVDDFVWDTNQCDNINWNAPRPAVEQHCTLIAEV